MKNHHYNPFLYFDVVHWHSQSHLCVKICCFTLYQLQPETGFWKSLVLPPGESWYFSELPFALSGAEDSCGRFHSAVWGKALKASPLPSPPVYGRANCPSEAPLLPSRSPASFHTGVLEFLYLSKRRNSIIQSSLIICILHATYLRSRKIQVLLLFQSSQYATSLLYKRPTLVPIFTNWKKSKEDFHLDVKGKK